MRRGGYDRQMEPSAVLRPVRDPNSATVTSPGCKSATQFAPLFAPGTQSPQPRASGRAGARPRKARAMSGADAPKEPKVEDLPSMMRTRGWADYALLESGHGRKLERYGRFTVVRPAPQCLWAPALPA